MMSLFAMRSAGRPFKRNTKWLGLLAGAAMAVYAADTAIADSGKIPNLSSSTTEAWTPLTARGGIARYGTGWFDPPAGLRGPIKQHPDYPLRGNDTGRPTPALGNYKDPILKPWAAERMRLSNEELLSGKTGIPFLPQSRCWPGGTPGQLLWTTEPLYIVQLPKIVYMIWQRDQWVRRIYMTDKHSEYVKPSWYGESIGHYENGELVVDTIGFIEHSLSFVDNNTTPHTKDLHVVERWKIADAGKTLEATVTVDDPGAFKAPWSGKVRWSKIDRPIEEWVCAENNLGYEELFKLPEYPMPVGSTPDF